MYLRRFFEWWLTALRIIHEWWGTVLWRPEESLEESPSPEPTDTRMELTIQTVDDRVRYCINELNAQGDVIDSLYVYLTPEKVRRLIAYECGALDMIQARQDNTTLH